MANMVSMNVDIYPKSDSEEDMKSFNDLKNEFHLALEDFSGFLPTKVETAMTNKDKRYFFVNDIEDYGDEFYITMESKWVVPHEEFKLTSELYDVEIHVHEMITETHVFKY